MNDNYFNKYLKYKNLKNFSIRNPLDLKYTNPKDLDIINKDYNNLYLKYKNLKNFSIIDTYYSKYLKYKNKYLKCKYKIKTNELKKQLDLNRLYQDLIHIDKSSYLRIYYDDNGYIVNKKIQNYF